MVAYSGMFAGKSDIRTEIRVTLAALAQSYPDSPSRGLVNLDVILPYLFTGIPRQAQSVLSLVLGAYRKIVCAYLDGRNDIEPLERILRSRGINPIAPEAYRELNLRSRCVRGERLFDSYLACTERVFYRREVLQAHGYAMGLSRLNDIVAVSNTLSAFFLFDDDVVDLEEDLAKGKETPLIRYLLDEGGTLRRAAEEMLIPLSHSVGRWPEEKDMVEFIHLVSGIYCRALVPVR